ncbi:prepilin-type N-terminal cleavage/methylation domain-containing protein [Caenimonas terrae]|uniref:Prepilin-type N-terminal cleavage/methylation domain-containing protein n=1 Tax=Caenimonas terrae TaxID=696074 RepID=A0ABW0NIT3_9BURK
MSARRRRQGGFSLLELLVAFVIMAFSLGMLYQATGGTVRSLGDTETHLRATVLAQSLLNSRDSVPAAGWNEAGQSAGFAWRVSSVPLRTDVTDLKVPPLQQVEIVIAWTDRNGPRQLELSTLLPQAKPPAGPG